MKEGEKASATSSSKGRGVWKMVSSNKSTTGEISGPATPPRRNGRQAALEVSCEQNVYVMIKVDITPNADV